MALAVVGMIVADPQQGFLAILLVAAMSFILLVIFRRFTDEKEFITYSFLAALSVRLFFGIVVHIYDLRLFFGSDAFAYDYSASMMVDYWHGQVASSNSEISEMLTLRGAGWGMRYLVAFIYFIFGKSIFVAQSFCAVIGAASIPMVYFCAEKLFQNKRVSKTTAITVAFFPASIIWSSQLLKDGLIVFLLVIALTLVIQIQKQFSWAGLLVLVLSLFGILSLRFYIFYVAMATVVGSFFIGLSTSFKSVVQRAVILLVVGASLIYLGVLKTTTDDLTNFGSLERAQASRSDLANSAESGYGRDENISTVSGALSVLPVGFAYLMFAPFPWEIKNFRQSITLLDVLLWWAMMPLLIYGIWYALKNRLRVCFPILIFTFMLTLLYSVFQGNVGTAYRQRTQIQVFLFMFIAAGWGLVREKIEDKKLIETNRRKEFAKKLNTRLQQSEYTQ